MRRLFPELPGSSRLIGCLALIVGLTGCARDLVHAPELPHRGRFPLLLQVDYAEDFPENWRPTFEHVVQRCCLIVSSQRFERRLLESGAPWRPDFSEDSAAQVYAHYLEDALAGRPLRVIFATKLGMFSDADLAHHDVQSHRILRAPDGQALPTIYWSLWNTPAQTLHELTATLAHELAHLAPDTGGDHAQYVDRPREGHVGPATRSVPYTVGNLVRVLSQTLDGSPYQLAEELEGLPGAP